MNATSAQVTTLVCRKCHKEKPLSATFFHRDRTRRTGFKSQCKECAVAYSRQLHEMSGVPFIVTEAALRKVLDAIKRGAHDGIQTKDIAESAGKSRALVRHATRTLKARGEIKSVGNHNNTRYIPVESGERAMANGKVTQQELSATKEETSPMVNPIEEFARNIAREEVDKHGSASEDLLAQQASTIHELSSRVESLVQEVDTFKAGYARDMRVRDERIKNAAQEEQKQWGAISEARGKAKMEQEIAVEQQQRLDNHVRSDNGMRAKLDAMDNRLSVVEDGMGIVSRIKHQIGWLLNGPENEVGKQDVQ